MDKCRCALAINRLDAIVRLFQSSPQFHRRLVFADEICAHVPTETPNFYEHINMLVLVQYNRPSLVAAHRYSGRSISLSAAYYCRVLQEAHDKIATTNAVLVHDNATWHSAAKVRGAVGELFGDAVGPGGSVEWPAGCHGLGPIDRLKIGKRLKVGKEMWEVSDEEIQKAIKWFPEDVERTRERLMRRLLTNNSS